MNSHCSCNKLKFIKSASWSICTVAGTPTPLSNKPLSIPAFLQPLFSEASTWKQAGLDFDVKMLRSTDPRAKQASARLQQELSALEARLESEAQRMRGQESGEGAGKW